MLYGIDWNGPVTYMDDVDTVTIPTTENPLPSHLYNILQQEIDPTEGDAEET